MCPGRFRHGPEVRIENVSGGNKAKGGNVRPRGDVIRAPRGVGISLALLVTVLVGAAIYLAAVRREALFVDLAGLSGLLFCF